MVGHEARVPQDWYNLVLTSVLVLTTSESL